MEAADKVKVLQALYAGVLADAVLRMGNEGVLESVTEKKKREQLASGKMRAAQLGITVPEEIFIKLSDLMGCADWKVEQNGQEDGFTATASRCMLCAMAKKMGAESPCKIYCLDPMEGMAKGINENIVYDVQSTLFDGAQCRVAVSTEK